MRSHIHILTFIVILIAAVGLVALSGSAAAQSNTQNVVIEPQDSSLGINETTTVDVVLTNADGGVGTFDNISVSLSDSDVARIDSATNAVVASGATANDSQATFSIAFGGDTADTGDVRLGSINLTTKAEGTTTFNLELAGDIFREDGSIYDINDVRDGTLSVEGPPKELIVSPEKPRATTNGTTTVSVQLTNTSGGVGTFDDISVTVGDTSVATVQGASTPLTPATATHTDSQATFTSTFGADTANKGTVTLGSVTVAGESVDQTSLSVTIAGQIYREDGAAYRPDAIRNGTLIITDAPEVDGTPTEDTDGDGKIDDLNGNGDTDRGDAQALFANLDQPEITNNNALFDYNGNGGVDRGDVQALFSEAS